MKRIILKYLFLTLLVFTSFHSFSQRWETYFGSSNHRESVNSIMEYYDKGYYIVGGVDGDYGWHIKTDINGQLLWDKTIHHSDYLIIGFTSAKDQEGNLYVGGAIWMETGSWPYVAKFDSCGEKSWCRIIIDETYEYGAGTDIMVTKNNEVVLLFYLESQAQIDQIFLSAFDVDGNMLWMNPYASKNNYPDIGLASGYTFIEHNQEYIISGYCYWPYPNNPNHLFLRPFFIGIDSLYQEKWILPFAAKDSVFGDAYASIPLNDTLFMGVGMRRFYNNEPFSLLMFFDNTGKEYGYKQIPNSEFGPDVTQNFLGAVERINDSLFIGSASIVHNGTYSQGGEFLFDTAGNLHAFHERPFATISVDKLIKTTENEFLIATEKKQTNPALWDIYMYKINANLESVPFDTNQYVYDSLCPHTIQSGTVDLSDCLVVTSIHDAPSPEQYYESIRWIPIKAFPNPVKEGKVTFEFENTGHHRNMELRIYNLFGSEVSRQKIYRSQQTTEMDITTWSAGIYLAVIFSNGGAVGREKFVVE